MKWLQDALAGCGDRDAEVLLDAIDSWVRVLDSAAEVPAASSDADLRKGAQRVQREYSNLVDHIRRIIVETYGSVDGGTALKLYEPLILETLPAIGAGRTLPVFTTNYDTAIEALADEAGQRVKFIDGFRTTSTGLRWSSSVYDGYQARRRKGLDIVLFKLHGSSNWYRTPSGHIEKLNTFELDPGTLKTIMIFPTQRKTAYLGDEPFETSYSYFTSCLDKVRALVVIGFSFRDAELTRVIWNALRSRADFSLVVVDPGIAAEEIIDRLSQSAPESGESTSEHLGRLSSIQMKFGEVDLPHYLRAQLEPLLSEP